MCQARTSRRRACRARASQRFKASRIRVLGSVDADDDRLRGAAADSRFHAHDSRAGDKRMASGTSPNRLGSSPPNGPREPRCVVSVGFANSLHGDHPHPVRHEGRPHGDDRGAYAGVDRRARPQCRGRARRRAAARALAGRRRNHRRRVRPRREAPGGGARVREAKPRASGRHALRVLPGLPHGCRREPRVGRSDPADARRVRRGDGLEAGDRRDLRRNARLDAVRSVHPAPHGLVLRKRPLSPRSADTSHDIDYTDYGAVKRFAEEFADSVEG